MQTRPGLAKLLVNSQNLRGACLRLEVPGELVLHPEANPFEREVGNFRCFGKRLVAKVDMKVLVVFALDRDTVLVYDDAAVAVA